MRHPRHHLAARLPALAALALALLAADSTAREERALRAVAEIVAAPELDRAPERERLYAELLRHPAQRLLVETTGLLLADRLPGAGRALNAVQRELVERAHASLPAGARREHLLERRSANLPGEAWPRFLRLGRGAFGAEDLGWLLGAERPRVPSGHGREVQASVADVLRRERRGAALVGRFIARLDEADRHVALRALGDCPTRASLAVLVARLGVDPAEDRLVLSRIGAMAPMLALPLDSGTLGPLRGALLFADMPTRREAALLVGRVEDFDSVPDLIELLESDDVGLARNAYWSLTRMTRLRLRPVRALWADWYAEQLAWWHGRAPLLFQRLDHPDSREVVQALNALCTRQIFRHRVAEQLTRLLSHRDPAVVRLACIGLGRLGSSLGIHRLAACLQSSDPAVREGAHDALRAITGANLPPDFGAWRKHLSDA